MSQSAQVGTVQSFANPSTAYFVRNNAQINFNNINCNNLIANNITANSTISNQVTMNTLLVNGNSVLNNLTVLGNGEISSSLVISAGNETTSILALNNDGVAPADQSWTLYSVKNSGSGLTAKNMELWSYSSTHNNVQAMVWDTNGNCTMPAANTVFTAPVVVTNTLSVVGGKAGSSLILNGTGVGVIINSTVTAATAAILTARSAATGALFYTVTPGVSVTVTSAAGAADSGKLVSYLLVETA